jgi:[DsrC]-trisulfide reductase subunit J
MGGASRKSPRTLLSERGAGGILRWLAGSWRRALALALVAVAFSGALYAGAGGKEGGRTPVPVTTIEKGDKCVRDTDWMRRNHMTLLKHQRDETMHKGIRGTDGALRGCIDCHASKKTGSVTGSDESFCQGCHQYAAVNLDCWECHNPKSTAAVAQGVKP